MGDNNGNPILELLCLKYQAENKTKGILSTHLHSDGDYVDELGTRAPSSNFKGLISEQMIKDRKYPDLIWKNLNIASWRMTFDLIKLMKESGCYQITISAESGNPRVLKEIIHKPTDIEMAKKVVAWCKEVGIETQVDFIIGFPGETWDEIRDTTNYAYELDADSVKFAVATPFPGTELMQQAVMHGMFPADYDFYTSDYLGFANPTMNSKDWTARDLKIIRVMEWDRINFRTEEKKKRYARVNELTIEEIEKFREETRKNLGVYFIDTEKRDDESQKVVTQENQNWDFIKKGCKSS